MGNKYLENRKRTWKAGKIDIELLHLTQGGRDLINTRENPQTCTFFQGKSAMFTAESTDKTERVGHGRRRFQQQTANGSKRNVSMDIFHPAIWQQVVSHTQKTLGFSTRLQLKPQAEPTATRALYVYKKKISPTGASATPLNR